MEKYLERCPRRCRDGVVITTLGPGDGVGEVAALDRGRRTATVTAITRVEVLVFDPRGFASLLHEVPSIHLPHPGGPRDPARDPRPWRRAWRAGGLDEQPRSATVTALDEVEALVVPANAFRALLERDGRLALRVLRIVGSRLREADRRRAEFGAVDTPTRLALRLLEQAHRYGGPDEAGTHTALSLTPDELAGWVGSSREAVSKALRMFRERGWVETGRRRVTILDEEALRRYADPDVTRG